MTVQQFVLAFAGSVVLASALLARFVHPGFLWVAAFVGANLLQSAFTGFCPLAMIVRRAGLPDRPGAMWTPWKIVHARASARGAAVTARTQPSS